MPAKQTTRRKAKKTTSRRSPARKTGSKRSTARKPAAKRSRPAPPADRAVRPGFVSHTEFASTDPPATQQWAKAVLGWKFEAPMQTPNGPYHMFTFSEDMGGGIRPTGPSERGSATPYCEVPDIRKAFTKAIGAGATEMMPPSEVPGGMGWIAVVQAPGGVPVGFWAPK